MSVVRERERERESSSSSIRWPQSITSVIDTLFTCACSSRGRCVTRGREGTKRQRGKGYTKGKEKGAMRREGKEKRESVDPWKGRNEKRRTVRKELAMK